MGNGGTLEDALKQFNYDMNASEPDYWNKRSSYTQYKDRGQNMLTDFAYKDRWTENNIIASEHKFMIDIGEHQLSGIVDALSFPKDVSSLDIIDWKTGSRPTNDNLRLDVQFCADEETEILSRRGWIFHDQLQPGEEVLTFNQATQTAEWQPALSVHRFNATDQDLVSLEGKAHSSLTTAEHRWPVNHLITTTGNCRREQRVRTSEELTSSDQITCAATVTNLPAIPLYTDAMVELVAWFWTEGHNVAGDSISLAQSPLVNPVYEERIRSTLQAIYGPSRSSLKNGGSCDSPGSLPDGAWRESFDSDVTRFYLNRVASMEVLTHFSNVALKVVSTDFINTLTESQLRLFYEISLMADGSGGGTDNQTIAQSEKCRLDLFQMVCSLLGIRTSLRERNISGGRYDGRIFWELALKPKENYFIPKKSVRSRISYTGIVWCPSTVNQTWYARRHGHVYFTGNTAYEYASYQEEFWCGYPGQEDYYPGMVNGKELWEKFKDIPRKTIWYDLKKNQDVVIPPHNDLDYGRLYRSMEQISRAVDLEVFVPNISGDSCSWCSYQEICPVYFDPIDKVY